MAVMNITTSVGALGTSNAWTSSVTQPYGAQFGGTPYLGLPASSFASWNLTGTTTVTAATFTNATVIPTSWTAGTGATYAVQVTTMPATGGILLTGNTYNCSIYWTDTSGDQQVAMGVPLVLTISGSSWSWAVSGTPTPKYMSTTNFVGGSGSSNTTTNGISNIVVCPEIFEAIHIDATTSATLGITALSVSSSRVGAVNFVDSTAYTSTLVLGQIVGPYAGLSWTGLTGSSPLNGPLSATHIAGWLAQSTADTTLATATAVICLAPVAS